MGADEPASVRMTQADGPGKSHRYPACGEVLLPAEKLLWRQAGRADVRHEDAFSSRPEPASAGGGSVSSASAARQRVYRAPGLGRVHRSLRSPAYAVLLDPPYLDTAGYGVAFPFEQYERMAERLRTLKGRAILSLNDHPEIRRVFDGFHIETVPIQYTVGLEAASRHEVIISSWDVGAEPAGLF